MDKQEITLRKFYRPMSRGQSTSSSLGEMPPRDMAYEYRRMAGAWLKAAREAQELTQSELAEKLNLGFTAVSAWEVGRGSLAPENYLAVIEALHLDKKDFARRMLRWTNPWLFALYENDTALQTELSHLDPEYKDTSVPNKKTASPIQKGKPANATTKRRKS